MITRLEDVSRHELHIAPFVGKHQHDEQPSGAQDAPNFQKRATLVFHMLQNAAGQNDIERFILEWKPNRVFAINDIEGLFAEKKIRRRGLPRLDGVRNDLGNPGFSANKTFAHSHIPSLGVCRREISSF